MLLFRKGENKDILSYQKSWKLSKTTEVVHRNSGTNLKILLLTENLKNEAIYLNKILID